MKSKQKNKITKMICILLACVMILECTGVSRGFIKKVRAEENVAGNTTEWDGVTKEKIWELDRCRVVYSLTDHWTDGYSVSIVVENVADSAIENWYISFPVEQKIVDIWNAQIIETANDVTVFKNVGWNQDIAVNQSVSFGFTANGTFKGFPEICELPATRQECEKTDYEITYTVTDAWNTGHVVQLCVRNISERTIEDWYLSFDCIYSISDIWNGKVLSWENDRYLIKNNDYNQNIAAGEELYIGFTVNGIADSAFDSFQLEEITLGGDITADSGSGESDVSSGDISDGDVDNNDVTDGDISNGDVPDGDITDGDISSGDVSAGDLPEIIITIATKNFGYNDAAGFYFTELRVENLIGTLVGVEHVKRLSYEITNLNEMLIDSGELFVAENWVAENIGLVVGYNLVTVIAEKEDGEEIRSEIYILNFNEENMEAANVDLSDGDGDGIDNYSETVLGLNPCLSDSDGDKLNDFEELIMVGTSPVMIDSDDNGVNDDQEDSDGDGLCNFQEIQNGTDALYEDTDEDTLNDGDEVLRFMTEPLVSDSDEDGLSDGEDVLMGFDPLNPDTDDDGILDGEEVVYQTCVKELEQDKSAGITRVAVSMECAGYIENEVLIYNVYNLDMRTTELAGLFGAPVEIDTEQDFNEATLVFTYDENALGDISEDNLRIMWYDEENDEYILLDEETVIDKENNTLTCNTTHFSTWLVVDIIKWLEAMKTGMESENSLGNSVTDFYLDYAIIMDYSVFQSSLIYSVPEGSSVYSTEWSEIKYCYGDNSEDDKWVWTGKSKNLSYEVRTPSEVLIQYIRELSLVQGEASNKQLYFFASKDIDYYEDVVCAAKEKGVSLNFLTQKSYLAPNMLKMAKETDGEYIGLSSWSNNAEVRLAVFDALDEIGKENREKYNLCDTDGDGLLDIYESSGMLLSNGTIVYSDPNDVDSDDDGINDFIEVGGEPKKVAYDIGGQKYTLLIFKGALYEKLSNEFIFIDGTPNSDGKVIDQKLDYIPYLSINENDWYIKPDTYEFLGRSEPYNGAAGIHNLYKDYIDEVEINNLVEYFTMNEIVLYTLRSGMLWDALACFKLYCSGCGGSQLGIEGKGTRAYINASSMLKNSLYNSANDKFVENMYRAVNAAESVLNDYNTEVYIAVSSSAGWEGCLYHETKEYFNVKQNIHALLNLNAFGTFNKANAVATLHCTYDPETKKYEAEYIYYITDFYDFGFGRCFEEQDALGLARSYELYGIEKGSTIWKKGYYRPFFGSLKV